MGDIDDVDAHDDFYDEDEDTQKDKYLTFRLGKEDFGVEIKYVTEIIGIQKITPVPDLPEFIIGVINLRGNVIPVMDVRRRFHLEPKEYTDRTCIIVVDMNETSIGLVVDEVSEVAVIPESQVDPPPKVHKSGTHKYIQGLGKIDENVKIILDVDRLLFEEEIEMIANLSHSETQGT